MSIRRVLWVTLEEAYTEAKLDYVLKCILHCVEDRPGTDAKAQMIKMISDKRNSLVSRAHSTS